MDDEIKHRYEKDHTFRNVVIVIAINILILTLFEYFDPDEKAINLLIGLLAGVAIGFLVGYLAKRK